MYAPPGSNALFLQCSRMESGLTQMVRQILHSSDGEMCQTSSVWWCRWRFGTLSFIIHWFNL